MNKKPKKKEFPKSCYSLCARWKANGLKLVVINQSSANKTFLFT